MRFFGILVFVGTATAYKDFLGGKNVITSPDSAFHLDPEVTDIDAIVAATTTAIEASDSTIIRGRGTIQQSDGNAFPLVGDYTCREHIRTINGAVVVGKGCTCLFFKIAPGCILTNSLAYWLVGSTRQRIDCGEGVKYTIAVLTK